MIILHRPPRHLFRKPGISTSEDVEICYESLQAILRLMRSYSRFYRYDCLPLDFVHTLSTAAGTILMKRFLENTPWDDAETSRSLGLVLQAMDAIKGSWPCVLEIQESIVQARQKQIPTVPETDPVMDLGFMTGISGMLQPADETLCMPNDAHISEAYLGPMVEDFWADLAVER